MRVVHFDQPVGDGELELVCPETRCLALRRQAVARREPQENVRRLRDHQLPGFQKRRSERQASVGFSFQEARQRRNAPLRHARHVLVVGACFLEGEPHEFPAALYRGPVIELVAHGVLLQDSPKFRNRYRQAWVRRALRSVNASNAAVTASSTRAERASDQWMPTSPPTTPMVTPEKARIPRAHRM